MKKPVKSGAVPHNVLDDISIYLAPNEKPSKVITPLSKEQLEDVKETRIWLVLTNYSVIFHTQTEGKLPLIALIPLDELKEVEYFQKTNSIVLTFEPFNRKLQKSTVLFQMDKQAEVEDFCTEIADLIKYKIETPDGVKTLTQAIPRKKISGRQTPVLPPPIFIPDPPKPSVSATPPPKYVSPEPKRTETVASSPFAIKIGKEDKKPGQIDKTVTEKVEKVTKIPDSADKVEALPSSQRPKEEKEINEIKKSETEKLPSFSEQNNVISQKTEPGVEKIQDFAPSEVSRSEIKSEAVPPPYDKKDADFSKSSDGAAFKSSSEGLRSGSKTQQSPSKTYKSISTSEKSHSYTSKPEAVSSQTFKSGTGTSSYQTIAEQLYTGKKTNAQDISDVKAEPVKKRKRQDFGSRKAILSQTVKAALVGFIFYLFFKISSRFND